ncbi:MAG TPA: flagellar basal body rod protein FlgB [Arenimonas sp.]|nr:flagellar basal body rod protein FlgB [Arenimonas sp.]
MSDSSLGLFGIHGQALLYRQDRLNLIAGNLANVDTPHFKARDIEFQDALKAVAERESSTRLLRTQPRHIDNTGAAAGTGISELESLRVYRTPLQPSLDGNTVDANHEQASFGRAALEYRATLTFIDGRIRTLTSAIKGE